MELHRVRPQAQGFTDLAVRAPLRYESQHLELPIGEAMQALLRFAGPLRRFLFPLDRVAPGKVDRVPVQLSNGRMNIVGLERSAEARGRARFE